VKNDYEVRGDVTAIFLNSKKYSRKETLIATSDLDRAKEIDGSWYPTWNKNSNSFYVSGYTHNKDGKLVHVFLHRWLFNLTNRKAVVDHICHDTLDNTRWALRICSTRENLQNLKGASSNSKTGIRGVHYDKEIDKYRGSIIVDGVRRESSYFKTSKEAEEWVSKARAIFYPFSLDAEKYKDITISDIIFSADIRHKSENQCGVKGVGWHNQHKKWYVRITKNRKTVHLGYFSDLTEAILVRKEAEKAGDL
jgi:hypothetical protein